MDTDDKVQVLICEFAKKLPKFPDGRIDYSTSDIAPVIGIFVKYGDEILLLKRSDKVRTYKGLWGMVAGYLDEAKPVMQKALEEIKEELGIILNEQDILSVKIADPFEFKDNAANKTWLTCNILIELKKKPKIKLDWEHTEYKWVKLEDIKNFNKIPSFEQSLKRVL
jgi:isopentenyldiphosphate isomerase